VYYELRDYLASISPGAIEDTTTLENFLAGCWKQFNGSNAGDIKGRKHGAQPQCLRSLEPATLPWKSGGKSPPHVSDLGRFVRDWERLFP
jgi:hypothetical protein